MYEVWLFFWLFEGSLFSIWYSHISVFRYLHCGLVAWNISLKITFYYGIFSQITDNCTQGHISQFNPHTSGLQCETIRSAEEKDGGKNLSFFCFFVLFNTLIMIFPLWNGQCIQYAPLQSEQRRYYCLWKRYPENLECWLALLSVVSSLDLRTNLICAKLVGLVQKII